MASPTLIARERLARQQLVRPRFTNAADLVRWFGAVQAQDYLGSLWAIGQRLSGATEASVEAAIAARAIVRTWPMRGTLHFVPAEDARWMLKLLTPRVVARSAGRYRELALTAKDFARAERVLVRALRGGRQLTRPDVYTTLARGGVSPDGQRGIHILGHLAQHQVLCFGPRQGRQPTFVLLDEWVPRPKDLPRDEALATLATRYLASHGPASVQDFAWWSGLPMRDARLALEAARATDRERTRAAAKRLPMALLLPPWDEYVVAYRDRTHALRADDPANAMAIGKPLIVINGRVRGAWRRELTPSSARLVLDPWTQFTASERAAIARAIERYARFLGRQPL